MEWSLLLGKENVVRIWQSPNGKLLHTLRGHVSAITSVAFSHDGSTLASGSLDGTVKLWNTTTFQERLTINSPSATPWKWDGKPLRISLPKIDAVAFHPRHDFIATSNINEGIQFWDGTSGAEMIAMSGHAAFTPIAFSSDGRLLATCDDHAGYNLFDTVTAAQIYPPPGKLAFGRLGGTGLMLPSSAPRLRAITFDASGTRLIGGSGNGRILCWDAKTGKQLNQVKAHQILTAIALSPDGKYLASSGWDGTIKLWNAVTLQLISILTGHSKEIGAIAFSPHECILVSSSRDRTLRFWRY